MEHREQLEKLLNTVSMLKREVRTYKEEYPADVDRLEAYDSQLWQLQSDMRDTCMRFFKRHYQMFSRPLTHLTTDTPF